jgi:hypothetical protein
LYNSATAYGKRPSDFFDLETDIAKWTLNEACLVIGRKFENMFNEGKNPFGELSNTRSFAKAPKRNIKKVKDVNSIR